VLPKLDLKWALGELDVHEPMAIHLFALSTLYYYLCVEFTIRFKESLKFTPPVTRELACWVYYHKENFTIHFGSKKG
jgi:hypothetical protein